MQRLNNLSKRIKNIQNVSDIDRIIEELTQIRSEMMKNEKSDLSEIQIYILEKLKERISISLKEFISYSAEIQELFDKKLIIFINDRSEKRVMLK